jgi:type II secretory pathway component GspD/PulD (secretin)
VYRDLLSAADKAFAGGGDRDRGRIQGYWGFASARSTVPEYQGLLSVGVDTASNSVVVSAPKYLMDEVMELAKRLDEQASAQAVSVVRLQSGMNSTAVRETLSEMLGQSNGRYDRGERRGRR